MKRQWVKRREFIPKTDGEQRWDRAYQYLLLWAKETEPNQEMSSGNLTQQKQEVDHDGSRRVCAGFHQKSS